MVMTRSNQRVPEMTVFFQKKELNIHSGQELASA